MTDASSRERNGVAFGGIPDFSPEDIGALQSPQWGEAVGVLQLDTLRFFSVVSLPALALDSVPCEYSDFLNKLLLRIHPEDRTTFMNMRSPEFLRTAMDEKRQGEVLSYRCEDMDGKYHSLRSQAFFSCENDHPQAVLVVRDSDETRNAHEAIPSTTPPSTTPPAGATSCTEIYEINLDTDQPTLLFSSSDVLIPVSSNPEGEILWVADNLIHPADHATFLTCFASNYVRAAYAANAQEVRIEYRRLGMDGQWHWIDSSIVPVRPEPGLRVTRALLFNRDITARKHAEHQVRLAEQYGRVLRNIYDELYELNITHNTYRIVHSTPGKFVAPPESGKLDRTLMIMAQGMVHPDERLEFQNFFTTEHLREAFSHDEEYVETEFRKLCEDGWYRWVNFTLFPGNSDEVDEEVYFMFTMDIDARKHAEEVARRNERLERERLADQRYRIVVEQTQTLIFEWSDDHGMQYMSPELAERFSGTYDKRIVPDVWLDDRIVHVEDVGIMQKTLAAAREATRVEMTVRLLTTFGVYLWCKVSLSRLEAGSGAPLFIGTLNDVDDATRSIMALRYRAEYDTLTGILNMQTFCSRAAQFIKDHPERRYHIIRMDINRFKVINDLFGIEAGDRLLRFIATTFQNAMNEGSICARMSGDVFCACVDFEHERIIDFMRIVSESLASYPLTSRIVPSFGICRVEDANTPINVLCDWANLALKTIKGQVLQCYAFYDQTLRERLLEERSLENGMYKGLERRQFEVRLQPKVALSTSHIVGAEALVRWNHPDFGMVAPDSFVPLFEKNGFIIRLDEYVWEEICRMLRTWLDRGLTPLPLSMNVSRLHFHDTRFRETLLWLLKEYNIPVHLLELELTESVFLDNPDQLIQTINELREYGFSFSLDDFGAGYSSLNMLKSLPIDEIKIDRGFLSEVVGTKRGKTVIRHMISLAKELRMNVVAEGVENAEHADFLRAAGCGVAQGFFFSRPLLTKQYEQITLDQHTPILLPGSRL